MTTGGNYTESLKAKILVTEVKVDQGLEKGGEGQGC